MERSWSGEVKKIEALNSNEGLSRNAKYLLFASLWYFISKGSKSNLSQEDGKLKLAKNLLSLLCYFELQLYVPCRKQLAQSSNSFRTRTRKGKKRWRSEFVTKQQLDDKLSEASGGRQAREVCLDIKSSSSFSWHEIAEEVGWVGVVWQCALPQSKSATISAAAWRRRWNGWICKWSERGSGLKTTDGNTMPWNVIFTSLTLHVIITNEREENNGWGILKFIRKSKTEKQETILMGMGHCIWTNLGQFNVLILWAK